MGGKEEAENLNVISINSDVPLLVMIGDGPVREREKLTSTFVFATDDFTIVFRRENEEDIELDISIIK
jgi:hypothetical protein